MDRIIKAVLSEGWVHDAEEGIWHVPEDDAWYIEKGDGDTYSLAHVYSGNTLTLDPDFGLVELEHLKAELQDAHDEARWSQHEEDLLRYGVPMPDARGEHDPTL